MTSPTIDAVASPDRAGRVFSGQRAFAFDSAPRAVIAPGEESTRRPSWCIGAGPLRSKGSAACHSSVPTPDPATPVLRHGVSKRKGALPRRALHASLFQRWSHAARAGGCCSAHEFSAPRAHRASFRAAQPLNLHDARLSSVSGNGLRFLGEFTQPTRRKTRRSGPDDGRDWHVGGTCGGSPSHAGGWTTGSETATWVRRRHRLRWPMLPARKRRKPCHTNDLCRRSTAWPHETPGTACGNRPHRGMTRGSLATFAQAPAHYARNQRRSLLHRSFHTLCPSVMFVFLPMVGYDTLEGRSDNPKGVQTQA